MIKRCILVLLVIGAQLVMNGMVYDNRYLPLIQKPWRRDCNAWVQWQLEPFFMKGHHAYGDRMTEGLDADGDEVGLFALTGIYNQTSLENAAVKAGIIPTSTLPPYLANRQHILWDLNGLVESQGATLSWYVPIGKYGGLGGSLGFIRLHSLLAMQRNTRAEENPQFAYPSNNFVVAQANEELLQKLNLTSIMASDAGLMDFELYGRFGILGEYSHKLRRYDAGINLGCIFPAAARRNPNNPAAVPAGGDGRWGIYIEGDCRLELKEDFVFGLLSRVSKRFPSTRTERMVVLNEPSIYGAISGPLRTNPGVTGVFAPYVELDGVRDGLGVRAQYTIMAHAHDTYEDMRVVPTTPINIDVMQARSSWVMEVVTATALYNFANDGQSHTHAPQITLSWDVPVNFLAARRVGKTHAIALTIEWNF